MKIKPCKILSVLLVILLLAGCTNGALPNSSSESSDLVIENSSESSNAESSRASSEAVQSSNPSTSPSNPGSDVASGSNAEVPSANSFALEVGGEYQLYAYNASLYSYKNLGNAYFSPGVSQPDLEAAIKAINSLPELKKTDTYPEGNCQYGLMSVSNDGEYKKTQFFLYENALVVNETAYEISAAEYEKLKIAMEISSSRGGNTPEWFIYMNPNRVTNVRCLNANGLEEDVPKSNIWWAAGELLEIYVNSAQTYELGTKQLDNLPFKAVYTFDNGVTYTVYVADVTERVDGVTIYVESSDMSYGIEYKVSGYISSYVNETRTLISARPNPGTGKPVIYLYPEKTQDVTVTLDFKGELTYTYPAYNTGWSVTASPNGELVNKSDNSLHYYLFWEGNAYKNNWDFSEGFVVKGKDIEKFLLEKLPQLGLNPREYNDFITYWAPELSQNSYNLITFAAEEYDAIAELEITPKPDTVVRVHMVWKAIDQPLDIPEQTLPNLTERKGFTVVEWGGTRA